MKILILNGSPKGENSITLQTCLYIEKHYPQHQYKVLHAGQKIRQFEKDFAPAAEALEWAELILFCYPVYTFLVPSQLHRFIELLKEHGAALEGKWASQITTSKHFYDVTAHRFIEENAKDLGLKVLPGLSADMEDLLSDKGRGEALQFFDYLQFQIAPSESGDISGKTVALVADLSPDDEPLARMVESFSAMMPCKVKLINIREYPFKGGCVSCFNCSGDGKCIYTDGFDSYLREEIQTCDSIVYAFTVRDHSMGSRFKMYDDRQFCNGHRTVTMGSPTAYLVNGSYAGEPNLQMVVEARANVGGNYLCGVAVNDGVEDPEHRTMGVEALVQRLNYALAREYRQPANFFGVGGMRIFRDLIYQMRGMMRADHKFFKSHGQYDFPQKQWRKSLMMYLVGWMMHSRKLKSKMGDKMNEGMMKPYKEAMEK
jgi:multimeric flavodoxin WrbA